MPFFLPYMRVQKELGFTRLLEDAAMYSADWQAWLASSAWAHRWMLPWLERWNEVLFPGFLLTALGLAGLWLGLTSKTTEDRAPHDDALSMAGSSMTRAVACGRRRSARPGGAKRRCSMASSG